MIKEQEEAIDYVQKQIDYFKEQIKFIEAVGSDYYDEEYGLYKNRVKQFETVLNMLKEKDKEIEKKDKIIYKMIDSFIDLGFGFEYCSNDDRCINDCDKCIKQYFERKVKE